MPDTNYTYDNGCDYYGHPVNGHGHCQFQIESTCPPTTELESAFLFSRDNTWLCLYAVNMLGMVLPDPSTNDALVPLAIAILYP